jgi:hypothetical protein
VGQLIFQINNIINIHYYICINLNLWYRNNGTVYLAGEQPVWLGNFNFNQSNASVNLQQNKYFIAEASQLVIDTVKGIEKELITL